MNFPYIGEVIGAILVAIIAFIFYLLRPKYMKFRELYAHGILWKWKWKNRKIYGLGAYCPTCGSELIYDDENAKAHSSELNSKFTFFICQNCKDSEKGRMQGGDRNYCLNIVRTDIYKLVRTEKYKEILDERKRVSKSS